jgi:hypothetical protein
MNALRRHMDGPRWALLAAVVAGLAARLAVLLTSLGRFDSDEAVTGVMAQRILQGDFPVYFGVQSYQGALEQYAQALVLAVSPDSPFFLRSVQLALTVIITLLVFHLGTTVTKSRWGGALAAGLYAVGPYFSIWKGVKSHGGYDGAMLFGLLAIILVLRLRNETGRRAGITAGLAGLCTGLAIWENYTSAYLLIPALVWAIGSARGNLLRLGAAWVGGLIIGAMPIIAFRVVHGINPPSGSGIPQPLRPTDRADLLLNPVLGDFLGFRAGGPAITKWFPPAIMTIIALMALGAAIWTRRRGIWHLVTLRRDGREPIDLVLLAFIITPFIYSASAFTWYSGEPRYLVTLYPLLAVALAAGAFAFRGRARIAAAVIMLAVSALVLGRTMQQLVNPGPVMNAATGDPVYTEQAPQVAQALKDMGIRSAYADYWVGYPIQYAAGDGLSIQPTESSHFPALDAAVKADADPAIVAVTGPNADSFRNALTEAGRRFTTTTVGRYTIFSHITPRFDPTIVTP